jgi:hypothetical protein
LSPLGFFLGVLDGKALGRDGGQVVAVAQTAESL